MPTHMVRLTQEAHTFLSLYKRKHRAASLSEVIMALAELTDPDTLEIAQKMTALEEQATQPANGKRRASPGA